MKSRHWMVGLLWGLVGCGVAEGTDAESVTLREVGAALRAVGIENTVTADSLRFACPGDDGVAGLAALDRRGRVQLRTNGLYRLSEVAQSESLVLVLTQVTTLSHDLDWGGLSVDPERGEVIYRVTLTASRKLESTVDDAVTALCEGAAMVRPILKRAGAAHATK